MKGMEAAVDKLPPQNIEAEQFILGAILIDNSAQTTALELLTYEDFYKDSQKAI